jgi:sodium transport system permease protein
VPVIGAQHAPNLVDWLQRQGVVIQAAPEDPQTAIREREHSLVLRLGEQYPQRWNQGLSAPVELLFDSSDRDAGITVNRLRTLLENYQREQGALRLAARGIEPGVLMAITVIDRDIASQQQRAGQMLAFLPYFLILGAFLGGMYLAIDTTAGERERASLEPLLASPASRAEIVLGKLGATSGFALTSMVLSLVAFAFAFQYLPLDKLGIQLSFRPGMMAQATLLMIPLVLCFACLQTLVSAYAKSFREAQTYLSILMLLPMLPSVILMIVPVKAELWMAAVPLLSQNLLILELTRGETVSLLRFALCFGGSLLTALLLAWATVRIYHREQLAVSA